MIETSGKTPHGGTGSGLGRNINPALSVVIPTHNRCTILEKALLALDRQTLSPDEYEVIVVDDGSTDRTEAMVRELPVRYPLQYEKQERRGPATARNAGIRLARGGLIVFIDSDIVAAPGFLAAHAAAHAGRGDCVAHGPVIHTTDLENPTSAALKVTDWSRAFFATGNASVRREHLFAAGLFDERFVEYGWEDLELGLRLRRMGLVRVMAPDAKGYHYKDRLRLSQLTALKERERQRARSAVLFYRKHPIRKVRLQTLITPVAFWLDRLLFPGDWTETAAFNRYLAALEAAGRHRWLRFWVRLATHHAYMAALRQALHPLDKERIPAP